MAQHTTSPMPLSKKAFRFVGPLVFLYLPACLGFVTAYLAVIPKVTISQNEPLDPNNPFSAPFTISDEGPLGINSVETQCLLGNVSGPSLSIKQASMTGPRLNRKRLEVGERASIFCDFPILGNPITSADIAFDTKFRPDWVWWSIHRTYRFVAARDSSGHSHWEPEAIKVE